MIEESIVMQISGLPISLQIILLDTIYTCKYKLACYIKHHSLHLKSLCIILSTLHCSAQDI